MTQLITFSNKKPAFARVCLSLIPLSAGCHQFEVTPAVLELAPRRSGYFTVKLRAIYAGVVTGIFQFRGVENNALMAPSELIIEAHVRSGNGIIQKHRKERRNASMASIADNKTVTCTIVEEVPSSNAPTNAVEISPTFVRLSSKSDEKGFSGKIKLYNNTMDVLPFQIVCSHEIINIIPPEGALDPKTHLELLVVPLCQPFVRRKSNTRSSTGFSSKLNDGVMKGDASWCGSFSVQIERILSREISVVIEPSLLNRLPPFHDVARQQHGLSSQTDSFYYTKRTNRIGLYFHVKAIECGSCSIGEAHCVPAYLCNGSDAPITVFLQQLQAPFACSYSTTTIQPKKFIEILVTFTPSTRVKGKVSTSLVAYSLTDKAEVTFVARGA